MTTLRFIRFAVSTSMPSVKCVALIDMDCFYCACERALDHSLQGIPLAVVQYNPNQKGGVVSLPPEPAAARVVTRCTPPTRCATRPVLTPRPSRDKKVLMPSAMGNSIIAISYEARAKGVTRFFKTKEALNACPDLVIVQAPRS